MFKKIKDKRQKKEEVDDLENPYMKIDSPKA